jgi:hypothetical protein
MSGNDSEEVPKPEAAPVKEEEKKKEEEEPAPRKTRTLGESEQQLYDHMKAVQAEPDKFVGVLHFCMLALKMDFILPSQHLTKEDWEMLLHFMKVGDEQGELDDTQKRDFMKFMDRQSANIIKNMFRICV